MAKTGAPNRADECEKWRVGVRAYRQRWREYINVLYTSFGVCMLSVGRDMRIPSRPTLASTSIKLGFISSRRCLLVRERNLRSFYRYARTRRVIHSLCVRIADAQVPRCKGS